MSAVLAITLVAGLQAVLQSNESMRQARKIYLNPLRRKGKSLLEQKELMHLLPFMIRMVS